MSYKPFYFSRELGGEKQPFNFAQLLLERCNTLFEIANESAITDNPYNWYKALRSLKTAISFKLSADELASLKKLLNEVRSKLNTKRVQNEITYFDLEQQLDEAELKIVELMYKYGLYYPQYKQKKSFDKEMEEDEDK